MADDPWSQYEFDLDRTKDLLFIAGEELGADLFAGDGPRLVLTTSSASPATVAMAGEVVVMLDRAGIAAELQLEDAALFFGSTLDNGTWDLAAFRYTASAGQAAAVDFLRLFDPAGIPFVGSNFQRWGTEDSTVQDAKTQQFARIVQSLTSTVDVAEVDELLRRGERILAEQAVLVPLMMHEEVGAAWWANEISGIDIDPVSGPFWNVAEWSDPLG